MYTTRTGTDGGHSGTRMIAVSPGRSSGVPSAAKTSSPASDRLAGCTGVPSSSNETGTYVPLVTSDGASRARTLMPERFWIPQLIVSSQACSHRAAPCPMRTRRVMGRNPRGG
jgi:hypothetical protein